jgi:hypothetical protein
VGDDEHRERQQERDTQRERGDEGESWGRKDFQSFRLVELLSWLAFTALGCTQEANHGIAAAAGYVLPHTHPTYQGRVEPQVMTKHLGQT